MADQNLPEMSASDVNFMCHVFMHMTEKPVIDWDSFAIAAGFKSGGVARTRWGQIKRKFTPADQATATPKKKTAQASASTPTSASKVKKPTGRVGSKGAKGAKGKKIVKDKEVEDEEVEDEEVEDEEVEDEEVEDEAGDDKAVIKTKEEVFDI
ncbi:hypothetical protein BDP67DRAFT_610390 [Colletotrichum lupini]|nr:hypothetical protein BDP67DRAFT_610390 [Colletotrichum lupini]